MDKKTVRKMADVANIHIDDNELESYVEDMDLIMGYMEQLKNLHTGEAELKEANSLPSNGFREDFPHISPDRDELIKNASVTQDGCFKVPVVVEP